MCCNTCPPPPQAVLADILRSVLGERLYVPDPSDPMGEYLSPEKLVNRVLVRASVSGARRRAGGLCSSGVQCNPYTVSFKLCDPCNRMSRRVSGRTSVSREWEVGCAGRRTTKIPLRHGAAASLLVGW